MTAVDAKGERLQALENDGLIHEAPRSSAARRAPRSRTPPCTESTAVNPPGSGRADPEAENNEATVSTAKPAEAAAELEHRRAQLHGTFGNDAFGQIAETTARFFGTPQYIVGQTVAVLLWVVLNSTQLHLGCAWDVYPFIALNLLFSLQATYAAPLILIAQTRQADRDKLHSERVEKAHTRLEHAAKTETDKLLELLQSNTDLTTQDKQLTEQIADLTRQIHALLTKQTEP